MMSSEVNKSSIEAAQEAIAKVNAILIAKGKLKPSQLSSVGPKKAGSQNSVVTREVEINNVPIGCRNMLTRGATQEEISKLSGAAVATKGRYMTQDDKLKSPKERPLYLHVQGTSQDAVNLAVGRINEIIANGLARQGPRMSRFTARGANPPPGPRPPPPPPVMGMNSPNQNFAMPVIQEKLYIGLEHAPPNFSVKDKVFGPGGSFLQHIQSETGAKVSLRGKGSGFIEQNGLEAMEPMHVHLQHVNMMGLQQAKELATNLIQTVQQEYAVFQQSFVSVPPPSMALPQPSMLVPPPQIVSLAQPPPLLPGQQMITSMPPPQQIIQQAQPQTTYLTPPPQVPVSLSAPGVVIPQLAGTNMGSGMTTQPQGQLIPQGQPMQTFMQPNNIGQQVPQFIQSSEQQQMIGQIGNPQQVVVSLPAPCQQGGQVVYTTIAGAPVQQQVQQIQQQIVPAGTVQIHQQQPQPGQIIQQQALPPPQQQQQHQHITVQQQLLPPPQQQQVMSNSQPYLQQPMIQTSVSQLAIANPSIQPSHTLQPVSMSQQPVPQPVSWVSSTPTYSNAPFTVMQQHSQNSEMIISTPQTQPPVLITTSSNSPSSSSGYVYKTGPAEEPKRRFTEEKQDEKVPEGLLGYEHGPPHLTNLMVQPGQPSPSQQVPPPNGTPEQVQQQQQQQQQQPRQQLVYGQQVVPPPPLPGELPPQQTTLMYGGQIVQQAPPPGVTQQPHPPPQFSGVPQQHIQQTQHIFQQPQLPPQPGQPPQPIPQLQQIQPQQTQLGQIQETVRIENDIPQPGQTLSPGPPQSEDKILMPPPPTPGIAVKRPSPGLSPQSGQEPRKKSKGFHEEDDDVDLPSSIASQVKEMKKYSFNQYSSTPQLYTAPPTNTYSQYGTAQNSALPQTVEYQQQDLQHIQQQQQQQQHQIHQQPPQPQQQYIAETQNVSQYLGINGPQASVYGQSSVGQTFSQYSVVPSPAYSPISSIQPQPPPPPPPPQFETQGSRSPALDGSDKVHGLNPQYIPTYTREDSTILRQPPPPPPPTSARSRTFW